MSPNIWQGCTPKKALEAFLINCCSALRKKKKKWLKTKTGSLHIRSINETRSTSKTNFFFFHFISSHSSEWYVIQSFKSAGNAFCNVHNFLACLPDPTAWSCSNTHRISLTLRCIQHVNFSLLVWSLPLFFFPFFFPLYHLTLILFP